MFKSVIRLAVCVCLLLGLASSAASAIQLQGYAFRDRRPVTMSLVPTAAAPAARITARVSFKDGKAKIDLTYDGMKPAVLFGGDVTSYVLWAVTPGGDAENLGELLARKKGDRLTFSTGKKSFALMVTAEPYYLVPQPSDLVVFTNTAAIEDEIETAPFEFDEFTEAARRGMDTIVHIKWDAKVALDLLQARKVFELATARDARTHASKIYAEAEAALNEANELAGSSPKSRETTDMARRAVALANEAINVAAHRIEALELEAWVAEQRAQAEALEQRAAEAEEATRQAQALAEIAHSEMEKLQIERERMVVETSALAREKQQLEQSMGSMRSEKEQLELATRQLQIDKLQIQEDFQSVTSEKTALQDEYSRIQQEKLALENEFQRMEVEKAELERTSQKLQQERDLLNNRLESALSHVADTHDSARGFVINLPDILFDVNEATLKSEAQLVLAKLAGILLIMPDQRVIIEGHTDSTGSAEYNLTLSEKRAESVLTLLSGQGIQHDRLEAEGFGIERPVAENDTAEGRRKNRRVEIVISNGTELASN